MSYKEYFCPYFWSCLAYPGFPAGSCSPAGYFFVGWESSTVPRDLKKFVDCIVSPGSILGTFWPFSAGTLPSSDSKEKAASCFSSSCAGARIRNAIIPGALGRAYRCSFSSVNPTGEILHPHSAVSNLSRHYVSPDSDTHMQTHRISSTETMRVD